jgi:uncharacterized membrane protein YraQ (UPF0718 family)
MESILYYLAALVLLIITLVKDIKKARMALQKSLKGFLHLLPQMSFIMLLMGLSLAVFSPEAISGIIGSDSGVTGVVIAVLVGAVTLIPSFITIPLGATLIESGAGLAQVTGFISALMGIGFVTYPMEKKYFGRKFALYRNIGAFFMTVLFVIIVSIILGDAL